MLDEEPRARITSMDASRIPIGYIDADKIKSPTPSADAVAFVKPMPDDSIQIEDITVNGVRYTDADSLSQALQKINAEEERMRGQLTCPRCGYYPVERYGCRRCGSDPYGRMMRS